jgi:hypothetical protein
MTFAGSISVAHPTASDSNCLCAQHEKTPSDQREAPRFRDGVNVVDSELADDHVAVQIRGTDFVDDPQPTLTVIVKGTERWRGAYGDQVGGRN